jgi:hypothetical protein
VKSYFGMGVEPHDFFYKTIKDALLTIEKLVPPRGLCMQFYVFFIEWMVV